MEELVGHRLQPEGEGLVGAGPDGARVRLQRLPPAVAERTLDVLAAAAGEHVEGLLDVGTAVNGDVVLVLPRLAVGLADLLPRGLAPGEAVTVLAPLVATLERLHAAGVAHGAVTVPAVRFDARGAPVLVGFERGVLRVPATDAAFPAAVAEDGAALRALACTVLRAAGPAATRLADELASGALDLRSLPDALFALADPEPVRLDPRLPDPAAPEPPGRLVPAARPVPAAPPPPHAGLRRPVATLVAALRQRLAMAPARARGLLRGVRLRVWLAAAGSLALLAGALVLLPGRGAAGSPEPGPTRPAGSPAARASAAPLPSSAPAVPGEPLAAGRILLAERSRCLAAGSRACLARIESAGSPVAVEDAAAVAGAVEPVRVPAAGLRLRSAAGGTAVLSAGDRTVLLLREPSGWRLRDVIGPPTARSTARSGPGDAG